jgi:hypothetical protein
MLGKIAGCDARPERVFSMSDLGERLARICQMLVDKSQFVATIEFS